MHALRHHHASVLLHAGESIKAVSEYLGHADTGFTLRTDTHLMPSSAERTVARSTTLSRAISALHRGSAAKAIHALMRCRSGASAPRASPADAGGVSRLRRRRPLMSEYAGQQFVGIDLHRRRTVLVRTTDAGEVLESVRIVERRRPLEPGDGPGRRRPGGRSRGDLRLVLGGRCSPGGGRPGASGASAGGEGFRVPASQERRARRQGPGGPAADGSAAGGVDRTTGDPGAARAGPAPGQAGRAAFALQGRGARRAWPSAGSRCRCQRPVRGGR